MPVKVSDLKRKAQEAKEKELEERNWADWEARRDADFQESLRQSVREDMRRREEPLASYFYAGLKEEIDEAQAGLEANQYVDVRYYLSNGESIQVVSLSWRDPNMLLIRGRDQEGNSMTVCVHMASAQIVIKVRPAERPEQRRPIGFHGERKSNATGEGAVVEEE